MSDLVSFFHKVAVFDHNGLDKFFNENDVSEGFSVHPKSATVPKDGYQVAHAGPQLQMSHEEFHHSPTRSKKIKEFLDKHRDYFDTNPDAHLGGWYNKAAGQYEIEPSHHIKDKNEAIRRGKEQNQIAIFDNKNLQEIPTGGTGVYDESEKKDKKESKRRGGGDIPLVFRA